MERRRITAYILSLMMLVTAVFSGIPVSVYADESVSNRVLQSRLTQTSPAKENYAPGDIIQLEVSIAAADGQPYGVRGYDNTITVDDRIFEVTGTTAAAAGVVINEDYLPASGDQIQKLKLVYWNNNAPVQTGSLTLGAVTLRVKNSAVTGSTDVAQQVEGVELTDGLIPASVQSDSLSFAIKDSRAAYHFGLAVKGGAAEGIYTPGDTLTIQSFVTSDAVTVEADMATNDILYDPNVFDLVSSQPAVGVLLSSAAEGGQRRITTVYNGGAAASASLSLCEVTLKVREGAALGATAITQKNHAVYSGGLEATAVTSDTVNLMVKQAGSAVFTMTPARSEAEKPGYAPGEEATFYLTVDVGAAFSPRFIQGETAYATDVFEFVTVSALLPDTLVNQRGQRIIWLHHDLQDTPQTYSGPVTLGSFTLRVKTAAPEGATYLNMNDANIEDGDGMLYPGENISAPSLPVTIQAAAQIALTGNVTIDGAARFGETLTANVSGIAPAGATCDLAWYRAGAAGAVATGATYTLTAADVGKVITLKATGTGAYTGELTAATTVVEKAAGPAAPAAPALASKTGATVTLTTVSGQEYRKGTDGQWQTDGVFSGLAAGTRYEFYTRVAETGTHQAGAVSPALAVTTDTYAIHMESGGTVLTSGAVALSLGTATEDYTAAESATITIRNSGTGTVTGLKAALSGVGANSFTLGTLSANEIAQGASATFTAAPKTGLAVGTHRATVTVTADNSVTESFDVTFEVTAKAAGVAVSGTMSFGAGKVAQIQALTAAAGLTIDAAADGTVIGDYTLGVTEGVDGTSNQKYATFAVTKTGESKATVSVSVYDTGAGQNASLSNVSLTLKADSLDAQGYTFTLNGVAAGSYKIVTYKKNHTTATMNGVAVAEADIALGQNMVMLAGDLDGDNLINITDYGFLTGQYGQTYEDYDLTDDITVNIVDYGLLTGNYGKGRNLYEF
ncbi:hypothetical protein [Bacilliculturomica massiliensis]|uniref:hypothetical protein n=1 Tax=Bacilliculturomica massiliensis TaxID=1917867 RepID=UPI0010302742|nr:hypothetical protein [Bacilliculturomica massiliensis]